MDTNSVIVAVASPPGEALRAIVRVSGDECFRAVEEVVALREFASAPPRGVHRARLRAPLPPCPCLLLAMPGPASSTGEDCAEIHIVGNPWLVERVVTALATLPGVRRALPGEFSARAVLNGRATIDEAQRVALAVAAATDAQLDAALQLRERSGGAVTARIADDLATLLALVEAGIDFTDQEDVSAVAPADAAKRALNLAHELDEMSNAAAGADASLAAPLVVLAGPPNAGKSTLFNALLGKARTVAAPIAGTTRDVVQEPLQLPSGATVMLADSPGLESAEDVLNIKMREHAERAVAEADVLLWCTPIGAQPTSPPQVRATTVHVATMSDTAKSSHSTEHSRTTVVTSALTGSGLPQLCGAIESALGARVSFGSHERAALSGVQRALAHEAAAALKDAYALAASAPPGARQFAAPELVAASLRTALDRLGEIAGAIPPDDVLGRLFSKFCIGK